jgi:hypothetical protein
MEHHTHSLNGTKEKPTAEPSAACSQGGKLERAQDSTGSRASVAVGGKGRTHLLRAELCSLRGWRCRGCWCGGQFGPKLRPVVTEVFTANNTGAKPLYGHALLNRHAARFPVANGSGRNVQLLSHDKAPAKVAGGPVKRVLAWNDG